MGVTLEPSLDELFLCLEGNMGNDVEDKYFFSWFKICGKSSSYWVLAMLSCQWSLSTVLLSLFGLHCGK